MLSKLIKYPSKQFSSIKKIIAREILDSRGNPTIEADVITAKGSFRGAVPSGSSTGIYEAPELRDEDKKRYLGKGVLKAVKNVNEIIGPALIGKNVTEQDKLDRYIVEQLDGSKNEFGFSKAKLGANSVLAVSLALARAGAAEKGIPLYKYIAGLAGKQTEKFVLPVPALNVINGGKHAGNKLAVQEFMLLPTGATSFTQALQIGTEVYHALKSVIKKKYGMDATNVGDEGGFAPNIVENKDALDLLIDAIDKAGHKGKISLGMDVAASEFLVPEKKAYDLEFKVAGNKGAMMYKSDQLQDLYESYIKNYPIVSIEDPFDQDDWSAYTKMNAKLGKQCQIVGDDLLVTNSTRIRKAINEKACNALLLKVNQIGSLTESIEAVLLSQNNQLGVMASHRSGETEDNFIADLAVGLSTGQIKSGAPCRSERTSKYNQILRIEQELGSKGIYAGNSFRNPSKLV